ncbi:MAG: tetratricopeptide repeat protein [Saprospiraceae bacterium]|nr:tetratricopeptide repeat protein [Saprospiraceae bacterium]
MDELYARIDDYLDGALSAADHTAFEAQLASDAALATALAQVREARLRLRQAWTDEADDAALRNTLRAAATSYFKSQPAIRPASIRRRLWWAIAATLSLLAIAWWNLRTPAPERIYARYRHFPEAAFTLRAGAPQSLPAAESAFNQKDYAGALASLQAYLSTDPANLDALFFSGLCQLELRQYAAARSVFQQLQNSPNAWSDEARWYTALSHLREGNRPACAALLRQIPPDAAHTAEARQLLNDL